VTTDQAFLADCRARLAFDLLANTWNAVALWALRHGPVRHGELRGRIGGISQKVLTETLREYELTALGRSLLGPIESLGAWAFEHGDEVMAAQDRYDVDTRER
jgi:DNA-binding HxlR family transcriptional regulator